MAAININHKMLRYRIGTAQRAMTLDILSSAAKLYEKSQFKRTALGASCL